MTEWIRAHDRLPENNEECLVYCIVFSDKAIPEKYEWKGLMKAKFDRKTGWLLCNEGDRRNIFVTHWTKMMKTPSPKGEGF